MEDVSWLHAVLLYTVIAAAIFLVLGRALK